MADETIGGLGIDLSVNFEALQEEISQAVAQAQQGGSQIVSALTIDVPTPDLSVFAGALQNLDQSAQAAGQSIVSALDVQLAAPDASPIESVLQGLVGDAQAAGEVMSASLAIGPINIDVTEAVDELHQFSDAALATASSMRDLSDVGAAATNSSLNEWVATAVQQLTALGGESDQVRDQLINMLDAGSGTGSAFLQALTDITAGSDTAAQAAGNLTGAIDPISSGLQAAGEAAATAAGQLGLFDQEIEAPYADATGQLNMFTGAIEVLASDATSAAGAAENLKSAVDDLDKGLNDAAGAAQKYSDAAQAIIDKQSQADTALAQAQSVLAEIQAAYDTGAVGADTLARAAQNLQSAFAAANPALEESGKAAATAAESFGALQTVLGALGIGLTIGAFVGLAESMGEAADNATRAEVSLSALTGSAETAANTLAKLQQIGISDGLAMPSLVQAAIAMTNLLPAGTDVVGILSEIADGAAISGKSLDAAASAFDRIAESGKASDKTLGSMGLNLEKLRDAMEAAGVSANDLALGTKKAFEEMDVHDRIVALQTALQQFQGIAEDIANNTLSGAWHQAAAQWDADVVLMAKDVGKIDLSGLKQGVNDLAAAFVVAGTVIKAAVDTIVGALAAVGIAIAAMGQVELDVLTGHFKKAATDITEALALIPAVIKKSMDDVATDVSTGLKTVNDLMNQTVTGIKPVIDGLDGLGTHAATALPIVTQLFTATKQFTDISALLVSAEQAMADKADAIASNIAKLNTSLDLSNRMLDDSIQKLGQAQIAYQNGAASAADLTKAEQNVAADMAKVVSVQSQLNTALEASDKFYEVAATATGAWKEQMSQAAGVAQTTTQYLSDMGVVFDHLAPPMNALETAMSDFGIGAGKAKTAVQDLHTPLRLLVDDMQALVDKANDTKDWSAVETALDDFDKRIQNLAKTDLPAAVSQMEAWIASLIKMGAPAELVQGQLDKLGPMLQKMAKEELPGAQEAWEKYLAILNQVPQTLGSILSAEAAQAQAAISAAEANGTAADQWVEKLEAIRLKQESLKISADGLGTMYVGLAKDFVSAFDAMGKAVADNIVDGKNWGQVWDTLLKNFAKTILETVIQAALAPLKVALLDALAAMLGLNNGTFTTIAGIQSLNASSASASSALTSLAAAANASAASINAGVGTPKEGDQAGSGIAGALSNLADTINVITGIIQAGAAVASTILLAHISSDTGHIEVNTRECEAELKNVRADLWSQYGHMYDRLGEIINLNQNMVDLLTSLKISVGGGLSADQAADLHILAYNFPLMLAELRNIDQVTQYIQGFVSQIPQIISEISTLDSDLINQSYAIIHAIDLVTSAINYHGASNSQSSQQTDSSMEMQADSLSAGPRAIVNAITEASNAASSRDQAAKAAEEAAAANNLAIAQAQLAAASGTAGQIIALQNIIKADNVLMSQALAQGNIALANQYQAAATQATAQLVPLLTSTANNTARVAGDAQDQLAVAQQALATAQSNLALAVQNKAPDAIISWLQNNVQVAQHELDQMATVANNTANIQTATNQVGASVVSIGGQITGAVTSGASLIASAVTASAANTVGAFATLTTQLISTIGAWGMAGGGLAGGGLPRGSGGGTYGTPQSGEGAPGNSSPYTAPPASPGGYSTGLPPPPGLPNTGTSQGPGYGGIPGAYAPGIGAVPPPPSGLGFNTSGLPSFGNGGEVTANLEVGETVISPGLTKDLGNFLRNAQSLNPSDVNTIADVLAPMPSLLEQLVQGAKDALALQIQNNAPPAMIKLLNDQLNAYEAQLSASRQTAENTKAPGGPRATTPIFHDDMGNAGGPKTTVPVFDSAAKAASDAAAAFSATTYFALDQIKTYTAATAVNSQSTANHTAALASGAGPKSTFPVFDAAAVQLQADQLTTATQTLGVTTYFAQNQLQAFAALPSAIGAMVGNAFQASQPQHNPNSTAGFAGYNPYGTPTVPADYQTAFGAASGIASYATGGYVPTTGLKHLDAEEWVIPPAPATISLPPDVIGRIRMPQLPGLPSTAPGAVGTVSSATAGSVTQHITFQVQGLTINDVVRQLPDFMKRASSKLQARSS